MVTVHRSGTEICTRKKSHEPYYGGLMDLIRTSASNVK